MLNGFETPRIAVLCSKRAPSLDALLRHPQRRKLYDLACVITTEPDCADRARVEAEGVPVFVHPVRKFHEECGAPLRDLEARRSYDALTVHVLEQLDVNCVVLLSYLYVATDVLLAAFPDSVINIHDGDPRYAGLHATRDAIVAGERETRSIVHIVTPEVDRGPIIMQSDAYPIAPFVRDAVAAGHRDIVRAYAYAHREWMMRDSWGDLLVRTVELFAAGMMEEVAV